MVHGVTVRKMKNVPGIAPPREIVDHEAEQPGEPLHMLDREDGIFLARDERFADVMRAYGYVTKRYDRALKALADS